MAMRKGLYNTFLQNDMEGGDNGHAIGTEAKPLSGLRVGYKTVLEVCIGIRTGDKAGSGSWDDPFDGSTTAKLDALLAVYAAIPNTIIRFRDGEFTHIPFFEWYLRPGCQIIGAGRDATILKCDPEFGQRTHVFIASPSPSTTGGIHMDNAVHNDSVYISDLTIDCNYEALDDPIPQASVHGIGINGNNNIVERVRVKNIYGNLAASTEAFAIVLSGFSGDALAYNNKVRDCITESPHGDYNNGIAVVGTSGGFGAGVGGEITGSFATGFSNSGFGIAGGTISNCHADYCGKGIYGEVGQKVSITNNIVTNGTFAGILLTPTPNPILEPVIFGNHIELRDDAPAYVIGIGLGFDGDPTHRVRNAHVACNTITYKVTGNTPTTDYAVGISAALEDTSNPLLLELGHSFIDNKIDAAYTINRVPDDTYCVANRLTGTNESIAGLLDTQPAEIETLGSTSTVGCLHHSAQVVVNGGYSQYYIDAGSSYVIQTGDELVVEMMLGVGNAGIRSQVTLLFTDASVTEFLVDQNGVLFSSQAVTDAFERGKFYLRVGSLAAYVGKTAQQVSFTVYGTNGRYTYFYRNVFIRRDGGREYLPIYHDYLTTMPIYGPASAPSNVIETIFRVVAPLITDSYTPPAAGLEISSAVIETDGVTLTLTFSEAVFAGADGFAIWELARKEYSIYPTYDSGTGTATLTLDLLETVLDDEEDITLTYAQPGDGVKNGADEYLASFILFPVTNNSTQT